MKKILIGLCLTTIGFVFTQKTNAQIRISVNINVGEQPPWRLAGYDYVEYYYLPDIECYYYVPRHQFIYLSNGQWVFSASLPSRCRNYNLYTGYKVVVNRPNAYYYFNEHKTRYGRGRDFRGDRHDNGRHKGWHKQKRRGH